MRRTSMVALLLTMLMTAVGNPAGAATPFTLTLVGPADLVPGVAQTYSGVLDASGIGVPSQTIEMSVDGLVAATATTDLSGVYSVPLTFAAAGTYSVVAIAYAGTALQTQSAALSVTTKTFELSVTVAGSGAGIVTDATGGIACPGDCTESYPATTVVDLYEVAATGSTFMGWAGTCTGIGACSFTQDSPTSVTATFDDITAPSVGVVADGSGSDIDLQKGGASMSANWSGFSDASGISHYEHNISSSAACAGNVSAAANVGAATARTVSGLSLSSTVTYVNCARAFDAAGNASAWVPSDGVEVTTVARISGGGIHTCAVISDGTGRCWGHNADGQLGDGTQAQRLTPVTVSGLTGAVHISAGNFHTCALIANGTARCWGSNSDGQLGDGTTFQRLTPVTVSGLTGATQITAGSAHTCALISDGTARCWGANASGQVGNGTTTQRLTPVAVSGLTGATQITAGAAHTCAVISDGTARCWGANGSGRLGDGTTTQRLTPVTVIGLTGATQITAGNTHTCALISDGTAHCWGNNGNGRLGDATTTQRLTPVPVSNLTTVTQIAAGGTHTCALISDGTAHCWGANSDGQVGDGTTTQRLTPVIVVGIP